MTFLVIDKQRFAYFSRLAPKKLQRGPVPDGSRVEFLERTECVPTLLQLGEVHTVTISLVRDGRTLPVRATAELKISATPARAAVFVDDARG